MKNIKDILLEQSYPSEGIINEAGLSRILQHTSEPFAIITAFRNNFSLKQNRSRNSLLEKKLKALRAGGIKLIGHWLEAPDGMSWKEALKQGMTENLVEESYFVPAPDGMDIDKFRSEMVKIAKEFNQDAIVFGDGEASYLIDKSGSVIDKLGSKVSFGKIAQAYSSLRGRKGGNFVFEGNIQPSNNIHRIALKQRGISWFS